MNTSKPNLALTSFLLVLGVHGFARGQEMRTLCDFETAEDLKAWDFTAGAPRLVAEGVTHGKRALEIRFDPRGRYRPAYIYWRRVQRDWSAFDALVLDVFNPGAEPIPGGVLIADQAWREKGGSYWNRHNGGATFAPGRTRWTIPVRGLYRGEAGSRNNDIQRNIDPDRIVRLDFGFGRKGAAGRVVIDHLRLVKGVRPAGLWAFDFGPPSQSVMIGWSGVSQETRYTKERGFGWGPGGGAPWNGAARDTTFGTSLLRDFCEAGGYSFHVDVPRGSYRITCFFENSGYWGGEQAQHTWRRILVGGREVWRERRPDGAAHALWRFEEIEPLGLDLWDTYMLPELARPVVFDARAGEEGLTLRFEADRVWGSKVAALAIHRRRDRAASEWLAQQLEALAAEFRSMAVCLDRPAPPFAVPRAWKQRGFVAWPVTISEDVTPSSIPRPPAPAPEALALAGLAVRGESEALCLALRPLKTRKRVRVRFAWNRGSSLGRLPATVSAVRYSTSRGFNSIAYHIRAHTLREVAALDLPAGVTRELIVTVRVPVGAEPGAHRGELVLESSSGAPLLSVPVCLEVSSVHLDRDTDFRMGFFGLMPPALLPAEKRWEILEKTLEMLRSHGMNMVCGGPSWRLEGWQDGQPVIDFGDMDRFFALLAQKGFRGPLNGYGGARFRGLHDGYRKGATGAKVERESGLPYEEALARAWRAVDEHARAAHWPVIHYAMCDETRVRAVAEQELAFMRQMAPLSKAFARTLRTSGSYSVHFRARPQSEDDLLYWHQRFFEALDISNLNNHDETVLAEARRLGREVQIYNQGRSRYSFGLYQWSEYRKGVRARTQWHLNILHGYQFFDLDGREPDSAMICYGRRGLYPTIHFERCREGAEDFYLYSTLYKRIAAARRAGVKGEPIEAAARRLASWTEGIAVNQRQPPRGYDPQRLKAEVIALLEGLGERAPAP